MKGNETISGELTAKQLRAIEHLLVEPTTAKAAETTGVSETTLWRWLNEPSFAQAYREARERLLEKTLTALQGASGEAVEVLRSVMKDKKAAPSARVSAAVKVLELGLKTREQFEVEERLHILEEALLVQSKKKGTL